MRFLKITHIQQRANSDCLVACAAMMLAAVDVDVDYNRLKNLLGVTNIGTPYSRLQRLESIQPDLHVTLQPGDLHDLFTAIDAGTPPVIFVYTGELPYWSSAVYHAVVLVGYTETEFFIHDPAFAYAPHTVTIGDLELVWIEDDSYVAVVQHRN
jgi:ABC-type bacteriocin/lantibiotic exporter with double-glycine peptidase domain